jgi:hypothetical protein
LKHLAHKQIDKTKWDNALHKAHNGNPCASSWYLDIVSPGWDALIRGDYEIIFPLCRKKKYGIEYLFQPFFTTCFELYSTIEANEDTKAEALNYINNAYRFAEINLKVPKELIPPEFKITARLAQQIKMAEGYSSSSHSLKQNLSRAGKSGIANSVLITPAKFVQCTKQELSEKIKEFGANEYKMLESLIAKAMELNFGVATGVIENESEYYCGCFIVLSGLKHVLVKAFTNENGRKNGSMSFLRDQYFQNLNGTEVIFDFNGSNLAGVAAYNKNFGAEDYIYYNLKLNKLPWPLRLLKK